MAQLLPKGAPETLSEPLRSPRLRVIVGTGSSPLSVVERTWRRLEKIAVQAARRPALHIVQQRYDRGREAGSMSDEGGKRKEKDIRTTEITVVVVRPEAPNPDVLDNVYQILAASKTA